MIIGNNSVKEVEKTLGKAACVGYLLVEGMRKRWS